MYSCERVPTSTREADQKQAVRGGGNLWKAGKFEEHQNQYYPLPEVTIWGCQGPAARLAARRSSVVGTEKMTGKSYFSLLSGKAIILENRDAKIGCCVSAIGRPAFHLSCWPCTKQKPNSDRTYDELLGVCNDLGRGLLQLFSSGFLHTHLVCRRRWSKLVRRSRHSPSAARLFCCCCQKDLLHSSTTLFVAVCAFLHRRSFVFLAAKKETFWACRCC